jgi:hypothetical protein
VGLQLVLEVCRQGGHASHATGDRPARSPRSHRLSPAAAGP